MLRTRRLLPFLLLVLAAIAVALHSRPATQDSPGRKSDTRGITANQWLLQPVGQLTDTAEMPQHCLLSPDGKRLAVSCCGFGVHALMLLDTATGKVVQRATFQTPKAIFRGMAFSADGQSVYVSGGPSDVIRVVKVLPGGGINSEVPEIKLRGSASVPVTENPEEFAGKVSLPDPAGKGVVLYPGGLALTPDGSRLWATEIMGNAIAVVDPATAAVERRIPVGLNPYEVTFDAAAQTAYVTLWGDGKVAVVDLKSGKGRLQIPVDKHPTGMVLDADAHRLYVACTHSDTVCIVDTERAKVVGRISVAPYVGAPLGSAPTALALSPDRTTLYVVDAGNNAVDAFALNAERTDAKLRGRLPAGWYPTGIAAAADGTLWVTSGRGLGSTQNGYPKRRYIPTTMAGLCQKIAPPTAAELTQGQRQVLAGDNATQGADVRLRRGALDSPIPVRVGNASPIKHVVYIIKENRTYDQVFGDIAAGNGDPKLTMYGQDVTTNQHRLAQEYVLLDNFYCDGTVSVDGHQWCKAASVADGTERGWGESYSQRGPGFGGPLTAPASPYLWEQCNTYGVSNKVYQGGIKPGEDLKRVDTVLNDLRGWEQASEMPQFVLMHLPNNHTLGTRKGTPSPKAMVAENDLAVGRLIEGLSRSKFWPELAVFIVEDDAQDGPDHVDAHRSPALVLGPWVKRQQVDSSFYDQLSVIRTMELILGLPPLSQFDAAAMPLWTVFDSRATVTPYQAVNPVQPLEQKNALGAFGQAWSDAQNFADVDTQPWKEFNLVLWRDAKGLDAPLPPSGSTRFAMAVRGPGGDGDEDGDGDSD